MRTHRAKPRVGQSRLVSPEADALSRELQTKLGISANALAEKAIYALAELIGRQQQVAAE